MSIEALSRVSPVDYVVIGHLSVDVTPNGEQLGGTALYAALTARAHGLRVGLITAFKGELPEKTFDGIQVINLATEKNTVFENIYTNNGREQRLLSAAAFLDLSVMPETWKKSSIVHLGPIANEIQTDDIDSLKPELLCATPQGWYRQWEPDGLVTYIDRTDRFQTILEKSVCVFSDEDLASSEEIVERFSQICRMLVVTEGKNGSRVYWNGDVRRFATRSVPALDPTGAGDIFATSFFIRLLTTRDPWEASRYANQVAAYSVTRKGIASIPTRDELKLCEVEILN